MAEAVRYGKLVIPISREAAQQAAEISRSANKGIAGKVLLLA